MNEPKRPELLDRLFAVARQDTAPVVDVTVRVLQKLRVVPRRDEQGVMAAAWTVLVASVLAASIAVMFGWESWSIVSDPMLQVYEPVGELLQ
jgi:hypothetical protein